MGDWFTVEQIDADTFAISEYGHWEQTHAYLLSGRRSALLIDTGLGVANIGAVVRALSPLPVLAATTHVHWDHFGGHAHFSDIAVFEQEAPWLSGAFPLPPAVVRQNLLRVPCVFPSDFDPDTYAVYQGGATRFLHGGELLDLGNRRLHVLHTPGHSPGHVCFYEPERGYLFSEDLIYAGCLDAFYPTTDPLAFFRSVEKVASLPLWRVLPGHFRLDVPTSLVSEICRGFAQLHAGGKLKQGAGIFPFSNFQIHV